jgi:membrane-anchored protein YejM (alkaline phosphatase superfamily)
MDDRGVVVIGVSGMRFDTVLAARTPHLDALAEAGMIEAFGLDASAPLASSPLWASVATGVQPAFHGIHDDDLVGHRLASFPDFLHALTWTDRRVRTYVGASWQPLATRMFRPAHRTVALRGDAVGYDRADETVTADAVRAIEESAFHAAFLHLGEPRAVASSSGTGAAYAEAVERADDRIGRITAALLARRTTTWTVVVVTDHGRVGPYPSPEDAAAWVAARGPGITPGPTSHVDIFPTAFAALDLVPHRGLGLAGTALQGGRRG